jgi:hypothetical protein
MSGCPEIDLWIDGARGGGGGDHESSCGACQSLSSLCRMRRVVSSPPGPEDECARLEPHLAGMIDGSMRASEVPGLCEHLARCASCSDIAASLTMLQAEWGDVPDPRIVLRGRDRNLAPRSRPAKGVGRVAARRLQAGLQVGLLVSAALALGVWIGRRPSRPDPIEHSMVANVPSLSAAGSASSQSAPESASIAVAPLPPPVALSASSRPPPAASSGKGHVSILCQPLCESVLIDGQNVGPSPVIRREVAAGDRRITLKRGTQTRVSVLKVEAGGLSQLRVKMDEDIEVEPGYLTVVCSPFCEEVVVDGQNVGPSPVVHVPVAPGAHRLTLKRASVVKVLSVTVKSGEVTSQRVSMSQ